MLLTLSGRSSISSVQVYTEHDQRQSSNAVLENYLLLLQHGQESSGRSRCKLHGRRDQLARRHRQVAGHLCKNNRRQNGMLSVCPTPDDILQWWELFVHMPINYCRRREESKYPSEFDLKILRTGCCCFMLSVSERWASSTKLKTKQFCCLISLVLYFLLL